MYVLPFLNNFLISFFACYILNQYFQILIFTIFSLPCIYASLFFLHCKNRVTRLNLTRFNTFLCEFIHADQGKTHIKKVFLVVGPLRFYPPYTNGLVVYAFLTIFSFSSQFLGSRILEKKCFFAEWSGGFTLPTPLVVRPLKYVCLPQVSSKKLSLQTSKCFRLRIRKDEPAKIFANPDCTTPSYNFFLI